MTMATQHRHTRAAVVRGATWLDREKPGWEHLVTSPRMSDGESCILAQTLGAPYWRTRDRYGGEYPYEWAIEHGFYPEEDDKRCFAALARHWEAEIAKRRKAKKGSGP